MLMQFVGFFMTDDAHHEMDGPNLLINYDLNLKRGKGHERRMLANRELNMTHRNELYTRGRALHSLPAPQDHET